ncbi:hypothetical protein UFOVP615_4 [uncultured Caudovirales phage]|uniref:Uncharacterized protein n=1 Tax=uncultured Caudovirales phage TaxID=2100421 RepID=A0A6J5N0P0_9CAUD|nr:hypothetical protein UFOVP615_4 [uncultured Caudovirales phage]
MSGTIITPSNARKPDSASGYQYLVEKMRLAAEWRDVTFIPSYQQGDVVFYQGNMYIKKNVSANSLVNPAANTNDWISLSDYIYKQAGNHLGDISYDNAGANYKNYLNSLTDAEKINPKVFNAATAAYMIMLDKGITRGGNYSFATRTKTGGPSNSYYEVQFYCHTPYYIQAWAINDEYRGGGSPNGYTQPYFYTSTNGQPGAYTPVNAIDQLGYTPANVGGTNWNGNAVATSLGYTPAKIGDSWISFRVTFTPGYWVILAAYTFSSNPNLTAFTVNVNAGQTSPDVVSFSFRKNGIEINPVNYNYFIKPRDIDTMSRTGRSIGNEIYVINYVINLAAGGALTWDYPNSLTPDIDIIIYFSKNL